MRKVYIHKYIDIIYDYISSQNCSNKGKSYRYFHILRNLNFANNIDMDYDK